MMADPVTLSWDLDTPAPVERAWALLTDTDQFNRIAGLGFRFEDTPQADGTVRRKGTARFLGTEMSWDEDPFHYRVPEWWRCTRHFRGTPASELVTSMRMHRHGSGTHVRYTIAVTPRGAWAVPLVWGELHLRTKPKIEHALSVMMAQLSGSMMAPPSGAPALAPEAEKRLNTALSGISSPELSKQLGQFLREAPLREQNRMAPLRLARDWGLPEQVVIQGMLEGVRQGALSLTWDLLCPACQGASTRLDKLADPGRRVHCTSCNVYYDATFPDSVAVSFRPSPALRELDVPLECAGSPARQPHIVASERLAPGEQAEISVELGPGAYRLRTWPPLHTASLEVHPSLAPTDLAIVATPKALEPARLRSHPGQVPLRMRNDSGRVLDVVLEKRDRSPDVLTAGRLLEMPGVKDLLPEKAIDPSFTVETLRATVVLVPASDRNPDPQQRGADLLRARSPRRIILGERGAMGVWVQASDAWAAAAALVRAGEVGCVISSGPILEVHLDDTEIVPMGSAIDEVIRRMPLAEPGQVVLPEPLLADAETQQCIRDNALRPIAGVLWDTPGTGRAVFLTA